MLGIDISGSSLLPSDIEWLCYQIERDMHSLTRTFIEEAGADLEKAKKLREEALRALNDFDEFSTKVGYIMQPVIQIARNAVDTAYRKYLKHNNLL